MSHFLATKDFLTLASNIVGKSRKIVIDTRIYDHTFDDNDLDRKEDIYTIKPESGECIGFSDLILLIEHMNNQLENAQDGRSFFYQGLKKSKSHSNTYYISWGS